MKTDSTDDLPEDKNMPEEGEGKEQGKIVYRFMPVDALEPNPDNPNVMNARQFNLLVDNLQTVGFTDPIFVRPLEDGRYRVVSGHHRLEAAKVIGMTEVPVSVTTDPNFNEVEETKQLMRHNTIRGKLDTQKFTNLYEKMLNTGMSVEELTDGFGFEDQVSLQKMIRQARKELPADLKEKFDEAAKEVKTIEDLSNVLNKLFTSYGSTLPYGYMLLDYGGKESVWIRMHKGDMKRVYEIGDLCKARSRSLDSVIRVALQLIAGGNLPGFDEALSKEPEVVIKEESKVTEEELSQFLS